MGLSDGLVRFSVGLDNGIARASAAIVRCVEEMEPASIPTRA